MKRQAPVWPFRLLRWFCKPWYVEAIEGDLLELYAREKRPSRAKWQLFINIVRFLRWRYIKDLEEFSPKSMWGMFKNYLKISLRGMIKNKWQSAMNVLGLAVGIASCLLMLMHVKHQAGYDTQIPEVDQIYRVTLNETGRFTPALLVKEMKDDYPEVQEGVRVAGPYSNMVRLDGKYVRMADGIMADSTFFKLFPAEFLRGNPSEALAKPNSLVLTEELADNLFPDGDAVGQMVEYEMGKYTVTAVVKANNYPTTLPYRFIESVPRESWVTNGSWTGNNFFSYIKLEKHASIDQLQSKMPDFVRKYVGPELLRYNSSYSTIEEYFEAERPHLFHFVSMKDIHLHHPELSLGHGVSYENLVIFSVVALFILSLACINYINMSTAKSSLRAREIGIRKVMGSDRKQVAVQVLLESFMVTLFSAMVGVFLAFLVLPYFNHISESSYQIGDVLEISNLVLFGGVIVFTAVVSGIYPALFLSNMRPVSALKGVSVKGGHGWVRSGLVVFQFAISLFLMIGTTMVYLQLKHMNDRELGLAAEQVYVLTGTPEVTDHFSAFRESLLTNSSIAEVGYSNGRPASFLADWIYRTVEDNPKEISPLNLFVSSEILNAWGLKLREGRFFDATMVSDTASVVVNEHLVRLMGWEEPVGEILSRGDEERYRVIGVVDDFATNSAKMSMSPLVLRYAGEDKNLQFGGSFLSVKIKGDIPDALDHIDAVWEEFNPGYPTNGVFLDDAFQQLYDGERRFGLLFSGFSILAIVIACIGLYALAAFTLERKRKEIAIRKVLGAHVAQIFRMITTGFGKLILISVFVAVPAAIYAGNLWLEGYAFRVTLNALMIGVPLLLMLLIALLTILGQVLQTAQNNPVNALQEE